MADYLPLSEAAPEESVADGLQRCGWWLRHNYFTAGLIAELAEELQDLHASDALRAAGIGRGQEHQVATEVRGDAIRWLSRETPAQCRYLDCMETLRQEINRELYLGLFEFEAHYAWYEPGAFYKKHLDSFRGAANRVVSAVTYLNRNWPRDAGGELLIYDPQDQSKIFKVIPEAGTLAVFLSEEIPHEVLPAQRQRASIAGWFRVNASTHGHLSPPL